MCGAVTRGTVALPGSEATSRMNGSRRNLGDLTPPAVAMAIPGRDRKSRRRSCWGRREESDGCIVPMKPRTKPTTNRRRREWREGGRSKERRAATHAPDSEPGRRVTEAASLRLEVHGLPSSCPRSRLTFDESPLRESCTVGSVGEVPGNWHLYPTNAPMPRRAPTRKHWYRSITLRVRRSFSRPSRTCPNGRRRPGQGISCSVTRSNSR